MKIKDKILSETSEELKQRVRDTANKLVMKTETIGEAALKYSSEPQYFGKISGFRAGAKWQQERSYSEDEVIEILNQFCDNFYENSIREDIIIKWFQQFKKTL